VDSSDPDEATLVAAARTDRAAFGVLYDRYFDDIYNYIARRTGDQETAEDIAAATWERALSAIDRFELRGVPFLAWLYRIAGNVVANHHRERAKRTLTPINPAAADTRSDALGQILLRSEVEDALAQLSETDQEILGLCYYSGLNPQEIATVVGSSQAAVHKRLHRARLRLRSVLEGTPRSTRS
jgi:RNA polymerase sigma-70 factor (ECF subfamily)